MVIYVRGVLLNLVGAYEADVDSVVVPGIEGEFGALAMHEPFLTLVNPGELRVTRVRKAGRTGWSGAGRTLIGNPPRRQPPQCPT